MIRSAYGFIGKEKIEDLCILLSAEINVFIEKIYDKLGKKLKPFNILAQDIKLIKAGSTTKAWEFKLNSFEKVRGGSIGKLISITNGIDKRTIRKQRALLIAAEMFVYYLFANASITRFESVKNQNQYIDIVRKIFNRKNATDIRDTAIRYIIEEIGEHELAQHSGQGWYTRIGKVKKHQEDIARILGSSEKTFGRIKKKQNILYTTRMLHEEDVIVKREIEEIDFMLRFLNRFKKQKKSMGVVKRHIYLLKQISDELRNSIKQTKKKKQHSGEHINRLNAILDQFEKEKINILRDIDIL